MTFPITVELESRVNDPDPPSPVPKSDFFDKNSGFSKPYAPRRAAREFVLDAFLDLALARSVALRRIRERARHSPPQWVLLVGIEVPSRAGDIHGVLDRIAEASRHTIVRSVEPMADRGKFANIDAAIRHAPEPLSSFDWLVIADDDITFRQPFLDDLIALAADGELSLAQPAHAFRSHTTYAITKRVRGALARRTRFVEIGPLTLVRRDAFDALIPFPESRYCYGIDLLWAEVAEARGFRIGIVDGTPIRHLRPIAGSYDMRAAVAEGRALLTRFGITRPRDEYFARNDVVVPAA